jgi:protein O-GlcNAc transferase
MFPKFKLTRNLPVWEAVRCKWNGINQSLEQGLIEEIMTDVGDNDVFLEFGSGYSTLVLGRRVKTFYSFETDLGYIRKVRPLLGRLSNVKLVHLDIGETREWGYPTHMHPQLGTVVAQEFSRIAIDIQGGSSRVFTLVDGRWRVLCFLLAHQYMLEQEIDGAIYFDDFVDRPHYHAVLNLKGVDHFSGRAAVFKYKRGENVHRKDCNHFTDLFIQATSDAR